MFDDYADWIDDDLELNQNLLKRPQGLLDLIFEKIGIAEKPNVSIIYFRKKGSFDFNKHDWNIEIFQKKILTQKDGQFPIFTDEEIVLVENEVLPDAQEKINMGLVDAFIDELKLISREDYDLFAYHYNYENVNGGTKEYEFIFDGEQLLELPPNYGYSDDLITIFSISKDTIKEIEDTTFFEEIFKIITHYIFNDKTKVEHIDSLLVNAGMKTLNNKIYKSFLGDVESEESINLFDFIHNISLLKYESSENHGNILFCSRDIDLENKLMLSDPITLKEYSSAKSIRKLLETSGGDVSLLCDGVSIWGIGKRDMKQDIPQKSFIVVFKGQGEWDVINYTNKSVMSVSYRIPSLPKIAVKEPDFAIQFEKTFQSTEYQNVWKFIESAKNQPHGTMVVVTKDAENEAKRLCKQSFLINKIGEIQDSIVNGITAIDGAILLDDTGICYAIGVILDGVANNKIGTVSRGARYNSALRYLNYCKEENILCLIVIVSEDKYIDIKTTHNIVDE
ncbi:diadenylate cyclase [Lysinibacillus fusiformis]|uniref:diadenylate cyclase n=1 Tax=Lysinibacillus fusiformis TaxID=28031 RepID=UPI001244C34B|nr:diadenylate cyclase [Lysinibacillus fusiformis]KAB0443977.1 hypothetical protein CH314_10270 [Lysinibacillus fusiformis]